MIAKAGFGGGEAHSRCRSHVVTAAITLQAGCRCTTVPRLIQSGLIKLAERETLL